jgi:hypothetical protein
LAHLNGTVDRIDIIDTVGQHAPNLALDLLVQDWHLAGIMSVAARQHTRDNLAAIPAPTPSRTWQSPPISVSEKQILAGHFAATHRMLGLFASDPRSDTITLTDSNPAMLHPLAAGPLRHLGLGICQARWRLPVNARMLADVSQLVSRIGIWHPVGRCDDSFDNIIGILCLKEQLRFALARRAHRY